MNWNRIVVDSCLIGPRAIEEVEDAGRMLTAKYVGNFRDQIRELIGGQEAMQILVDDRVEDILQQLRTEVQEARQPLQLRRPEGVGEGVGAVGEALEEVGGALEHALRHNQSTFDFRIGQHRGQQLLQLGHRRCVTETW